MVANAVAGAIQAHLKQSLGTIPVAPRVSPHEDAPA
jgi:hypothetical protein